MKKVFLLILAGGIMMTACKKEEMKSTNNNLASNLKLIKENVFENGYLGDLYQNPNDGKMLFIIKQMTSSAKMQLTKNYTERGGFFNCKDNSDECEIDYVKGIVYVRKDADPKK